jgi:hypothetical protein
MWQVQIGAKLVLSQIQVQDFWKNKKRGFALNLVHL